MRRHFAVTGYFTSLTLSLAILAGCEGVEIELDDFLEDLVIAVGDVQTDDPEVIVLPDYLIEREEVVVIRDDVEVITIIEEQLIVEELPNVNLLGFKNFTGFDIFVRYAADGDTQSVFVLDGETLLLEYRCLEIVELIGEDDFDPFTGDFVQDFELDAAFFNPEDFFCGEALIMTFTDDAVIAEPERIDLVR